MQNVMITKFEILMRMRKSFDVFIS